MYTRKRKHHRSSLPRASVDPDTSGHEFKTTAPKPKTSHVVETYRGRDRYLGRHVSFDEAIASEAGSESVAGVKTSLADVELLTHQGAFQLPVKSVQDEYVAAYMQYCNIWTPIVDPEWLNGSSVSYLLLQSIFLAASRVTKQPPGKSADFYRKAKLLFFFGNERDPLVSIASAVLLHWFNPVGPETISTDTSGFWLRTAEAIAFQIGLHNEPRPDSRHAKLRRRLWWTLVVSFPI